MKGLVLAIGWLLAVVVLGVTLTVNKAHNCRDAGWEYHFWTEQCLPKEQP